MVELLIGLMFGWGCMIYMLVVLGVMTRTQTDTHGRTSGFWRALLWPMLFGWEIGGGIDE